jgi:hypothetical protein
MKGKTSAILVLCSVMALGTVGFFTGFIDINLPDNSSEPNTEYLTVYINSYNFTQILLQDFTINYTIDGFGTFDLYQNKSMTSRYTQGAEGLKIFAWCSLNFTPATELKDNIGQRESVNEPITSQPEDEEDEEPIQARPRPDCWVFDFDDKLTGVNIITTVIISFSNVEAIGIFQDYPSNDPIYLNFAETFLQIQLSKNGVLVPANELSAESLTVITSSLFEFTPDNDWGYSPSVTKSLSSIFMITNAEGQVVKLSEI